MKNKSLFALSMVALLASTTVMGQVVPDAGRTLQELTQGQTLEQSSQGALVIDQPLRAAVESGGAEVMFQGADLSGNVLFSNEELTALLTDALGQSYDLAGIYQLVDRISQHYRRAGYPFARAFLPAQDIDDGRVQIVIVEGRYGDVQVAAEDASVQQNAQAYLGRLRSGDAIENRQLERSMLILGDLPGFTVSPLIRPGQAEGSGDLLVNVDSERALRYGVSTDNHGNRFTGEQRVSAYAQKDGLLMFGDRFSVNAMYSEEDLWLGSLSYALPIGTSGLRAQAAYAHTAYELGKDYAELDARGFAKVSSIGLSYPLLRSQRRNVSLSATYQYKDLEDRVGLVAQQNRKHSSTLPLAINADVRDGFAGGGVTFGALTWTHGDLSLDDELRTQDRFLQTAGSFDKVNLDVARVQSLPGAFSLFARVAAQWAGDNLDSSESFGLGGADGVRAYPAGEGFGDEGWRGLLELRYALGNFTPYAFYDEGKVDINARPAAQVEGRSERRAGTGLGLRWAQQGWRIEGAAAWRTHGGAPQSDTRDSQPQAWMSLAYDF